MSTEKNTMNRIDVMKSIMQKRTGTSQKTVSDEMSRERSIEKTARTRRKPETLKQSAAATSEESTETSEKRPTPHESSEEPSETTQKFAPPTPSYEEPSIEETLGIGPSSTQLERPEGTMLREIGPVELIESKQGVMRLSMAPMRENIWDMMMKLKRGDIKPSVAKEFSAGCNIIMKSVKAENDATRAMNAEFRRERNPARVLGND